MLVYILIGVAVLAAIYFLFLKGKPEDASAELPAKKEPEKLPKKEEKKELPAKETKELKASTPEPSPPKRSAAETVGETPAAKAVSDRPLPIEEKKPEPKPEVREEELARSTVLDPALVRRGLAKTRGGFIAKLADLIRGRKEIDPALLSEIEEVLLTSDVGV